MDRIIAFKYLEQDCGLKRNLPTERNMYTYSIFLQKLEVYRKADFYLKMAKNFSQICLKS